MNLPEGMPASCDILVQQGIPHTVLGKAASRCNLLHNVPAAERVLLAVDGPLEYYGLIGRPKADQVP